MNFLEYTRKLNKLAIELQEEQEIITEEDIVKAITYLNNILIEDTGDCLIFLSALNLCNAYVKQNNSKITYAFKKCIEYILEILNHKYIEDIYISKSKNNGTLFIFQIGEIQFSFHDEKSVQINEKYLKDLSWDGIKKQKCAKSIFNSVINNKLRVTNETFRGNNLQEKVARTLENYNQQKVELSELLSVKI